MTATLDSPNVFDVCIIGAGLAGLSAADRLLAMRPTTKLVVLEARPRVGGRTHTVKFAADGYTILHDGVSARTATSSVASPSKAIEGISIDLGGQWIGPEHSEALALIERFGLQLEEQIYSFDEDGHRSAASASNPHDAQRLVEAINYPLIELQSDEVVAIEGFLRLIEEFRQTVDLAAPWKHPQAAEHDAITLSEALDKHVATAEARRQLGLFAQTVMACDPSQLSFLFFLWYVASGGGCDALGDGEQGAQKWKVVGGVQQLSVRLKESIEKRGGQVRMASPVEELLVSKDQSSAENTAFFKVIVGSLSSLSRPYVRARHVVFAASPQLLPQLHFDPPLPLEKQLLCASFIRPNAIKVFAIYKTQFWAKPVSRSDLPHFSTLGPVHNIFHAPCGRVSALVGLITGATAMAFAKLAPQKRRRLVLKQYARMYDDPVAFEPEFYYEVNWATEEYSGGCFASILPPNILTRYGEWIRRPLGPLHFCSTETAVAFSGYFEGAIRSGQRVADELALALRSQAAKL